MSPIRSTLSRAVPARARPRLRRAAAALRARRDADLLLGSGLFDAQWYATQAGCPSDPATAARHYLRHGRARSPHPLFDTDYVLERNTKIGRRNPLLAYLTQARFRTKSTHRLFDLKYYVAEHPEAAEHRYGPLAYYLATGVGQGHAPNRWFVPGEAEGFVDWVRARTLEAAARERTTTSRWTSTPPVPDDATPRPGDELVSVVLPVGAVALLQTCANAVLSQSWRALELLVVHPAGLTDATRLALGPVADDPRVRFVAADGTASDQAHEVDLVAAGIEAATGQWLAFCRPAARWHPHHLAAVIGRAAATGAGFDVVERTGTPGDADTATQWSVGEATPERSLAAPQVDPSALVVRRSWLADCGGIDPSLRSGAWYDLELRLGAASPIVLVRRVGVLDDAARREQASEAVPARDRPRFDLDDAASWLDVAVARHLVDWAGIDPGGDPGVVSVIVPTYADSAMTVRAVERVADARAAHPDGPVVEVVVVDNGCRPGDAVVLDSLARRFAHTVVHHEPVNRGFSVGNDVGLGLTRGSVVVFLNNDTSVDDDWLAPLLTALDDPEVHGAQSLLVYPAGSIQSAGIAFPVTGGIPHVLLQGFPVEDARGIEADTLHAATAAALAMRRRDVVALCGFDPLFRNGMEDVDLCLRSLRQRPGRFTVRPDSIVVHHESRTPGRFRDVAVNRRILLDRHGAAMPGDDVALWAARGYEVTGHRVRTRLSADHRIDVPEPELARRPLAEVREGIPRLRWALKNPAPYGRTAELWGDTHFLRRLALALERLGQQVVIDNRDEFDRDSGRFDDVVLVLRGITPFRPAYGQLSFAWLISHPELLERSEAQGYDRVFAASEVWAERMTREWGVRIDPLLQATDPALFHPDRGEPDTGHPALFVGMGLRRERPLVRDAVAAGLPLAIYGHGWDDSPAAPFVRATNLPNLEVGEAYRRAGVVLNDHWDDMRVDGFLSNRLFDAAASGARVITDDVHGLDGLFGRSVQVARDVDDLRRLATSSDPDSIFGDDDERRAVAHRVHAEHSFDARARTLLDTALELRQKRHDGRP